MLGVKEFVVKRGKGLWGSAHVTDKGRALCKGMLEAKTHTDVLVPLLVGKCAASSSLDASCFSKSCKLCACFSALAALMTAE